MSDAAKTFVVRILYRGEDGTVSLKRISPRGMYHGRSAFNAGEPQTYCKAVDIDLGAKRTYAMARIVAWGDAQVDAILALKSSLGSPHFWDPALTHLRSQFPKS